ncbi:triple tyrosine motif-containing protein [Gillisia sp. CAL575]|uniref:triple tyrosine motif-containing protein n=1 Tax=Gillisia sp. CAL575 TaxID=985255 RepID=UPI0003A10211|nr:triple tyrosine motif-containing protein [Gillisia sp. CAL575]
MDVLKEMKVVLVSLLLTACFTLQGQEIAPYFTNYLKTDYRGENSNWDITQHPDGTVYVANNKNLLAFNGDFWTKYSLPSKGILRSVNVINDTLYSGSYHQFGYWIKNDKNELQYTSLSNSIDQEIFNNDEIWKIIPFGEEILFQSFNKIYRYNTQTKRIRILPFGNISAVYTFLIHDNLYVGTKNNGIYKIENDSITKLEWSEPLDNYTIQSIVDYKGGLLIATQNNGLYYFKDTVLKKWFFSSIDDVPYPEINNLKIVNELVCVGTINNGLMVYNAEGVLKHVYNKKNGLANNTVLRQFLDDQNNLWLALDNGLSKVLLTKNVYAYNDKSGLLGTVYSIVKQDENLLIGSNHGVFKLKGTQLELLEASNGHVWNLTKVGDEIICGHNNGTYSIKNNEFNLISSTNGGMGFVNISGTEYYLQPNYSGVTRYIKVNGVWESYRFENLDFPVGSIYFDQDQHLWVDAAHKGIFKYKISDDFNELKLLKSFNDPNVTYEIFAIGTQIFLTKNNEIYRYDPLHGALAKDAILEQKLYPFASIATINKELLVIKNLSSLRITSTTGDNLYNFNEDLINSRIVKNSPSANKIDNSLFLFLDDGFLQINPINSKKETEFANLSLETVKVNGNSISLDSSVNIPFKKNTISFKFSSHSPGTLSLPLYSYKLEGYDKKWSVPNITSHVVYQNLHPGDYEFKVRQNSADESIEKSLFSFSVLQPWYFNIWAWVGYMLVLIIILFLVHYYNKIKFKRKKKVLEKELDYKQKLTFQKQNFENNSKITLLEQEKLKTQLKSKSKELASYAALMAKKEDMLNEIEKEILKSNIKKENKMLYSKLMNIKEQQSNSQNDWALFDRNFNEVHDDFFKNLQKKFPDLTPKDLKMCAYLTMNLSSKEIAPLVGITYRSVELHRYRLRKKFDLPKNKNLVKFLHNVL